MAKKAEKNEAVEELSGDSRIITGLPEVQHAKLHDSVKHMDLCGNGLMLLPDGRATFGLTLFKAVGNMGRRAGVDFKLPETGRYIVVAEYYASAGTTLTESKRCLVPVGYGLLDSVGTLIKITTADIPEYFDKIDDITQKSTAARLKTVLEPVTPCNKLYLELARYKDSQKAGYRREYTEDDETMPTAQRNLAKTGIIKLIRAQELTPEYVASLTDGDLATIALKLSRKYLGGALPLLQVRWDYGMAAKTDLGRVEIIPCNKAANAVKNTVVPEVMEDMVPDSSTVIYLHRRACIRNAHNFYNVLMHLMIHALGLPGAQHYRLFESIVRQCNTYYAELNVVLEHSCTEEDVVYRCPVCGEIMPLLTHKGNRTATATCINGHTNVTIRLEDAAE